MKGSGRGPERNNERGHVEELYHSPLTLKQRVACLDTHGGEDPLLPQKAESPLGHPVSRDGFMRGRRIYRKVLRSASR
jgi:hypothetical protein